LAKIGGGQDAAGHREAAAQQTKTSQTKNPRNLSMRRFRQSPYLTGDRLENAESVSVFSLFVVWLFVALVVVARWRPLAFWGDHHGIRRFRWAVILLLGKRACRDEAPNHQRRQDAF
jgi:hypothetical protein